MSNTSGTFQMPATLTIYDVVEVYKDIRVSLPECISLKETTEMDSCGIQLLSCIEKELSSCGRTLQVIDVPPRIQTKLRRFSLAFAQWGQ